MTTQISPALLDVLVCPDEHHTPLTVSDTGSALSCSVCRRSYPVRDGIPVLLLDEATTAEGPGGAHEADGIG